MQNLFNKKNCSVLRAITNMIYLNATSLLFFQCAQTSNHIHSHPPNNPHLLQHLLLQQLLLLREFLLSLRHLIVQLLPRLANLLLNIHAVLATELRHGVLPIDDHLQNVLSSKIWGLKKK